MRVDNSRIERVRSRLNPPEEKPNHDNFERIKNIATIFSAIAIPIVLTISGYYIQRQLTSEGLRKDYVSIAAGILKENPANQEPELRTWAVKVLDDNSPVPFSKKAKEGLKTGGVIVSGLAFLGPPSFCREKPVKRDVINEYTKLVKNIKTADHDKAVNMMLNFIESLMKQEVDVVKARGHLECMQDWADTIEKADINFRKEIGAPSSKSIWEEIDKNKAAEKTKGQPVKNSTKAVDNKS